MASLREAEREELIVLLYVQTRENSARGVKQVDGGRRLSCGVEIPCRAPSSLLARGSPARRR
jgi:hypothetical protein